MSQPIVEVRDLSFSFSRKKVIDGLSVSFPKGEWAVIAGRNGVGKSTLLRALSGVLLPDSGKVIRSQEAPAKKIGFISDALSLFEDWTVERARAFHCRVFAIGEFDDRLLKRLGLSQKDRIKNLSAGERAILHLSLVLSQKPSLLLVDEVMHMLDPYIRELFIETLIEHLAASRATVLTVNHTFSEIEKIPERVLVMDDGKFVIDETSEALRGKMKKIVSRDPLPETLPCFFKKTDGIYKEYYIYPFREELLADHALDFQDIALAEIIKAFIGGGYEQKRMA
ncbi:MAG: ABC transporter ATP-binding protein [Candidatus Aminicenantes bacterium]|nr:ABC transporter ATP-binding protein [Acidobacteriota bacterium]MCG2809900.1 ABC transporter ATP-binding protein [Candidatus Aminicenantes bacterium]